MKIYIFKRDYENGPYKYTKGTIFNEEQFKHWCHLMAIQDCDIDNVSFRDFLNSYYETPYNLLKDITHYDDFENFSNYTESTFITWSERMYNHCASRWFDIRKE